MPRFLIIPALGVLLSSCDSLNMPATKPENTYAFGQNTARKDPWSIVSTGYWDKPENLTGAHRIVIDVDMQTASYFSGGRQVGQSTVSTGKGANATPRKRYTVLSKDEDHRSSKYGHVEDSRGNTIVSDFTMGVDKMPRGGKYVGASMFYGMQLNYTGIWMHEGIVTSAPESHGCIRLPSKMAKIFFENAPIGTEVIVK